MHENVIRLINILNDRFKIPSQTDGFNILMTKADLVGKVSMYWPMEDNWKVENLNEAIIECGIPSIVNINNERIYLLMEQ